MQPPCSGRLIDTFTLRTVPERACRCKSECTGMHVPMQERLRDVARSDPSREVLVPLTPASRSASWFRRPPLHLGVTVANQKQRKDLVLDTANSENTILSV
jgi:hypothetical protein